MSITLLFVWTFPYAHLMILKKIFPSPLLNQFYSFYVHQIPVTQQLWLRISSSHPLPDRGLLVQERLPIQQKIHTSQTKLYTLQKAVWNFIISIIFTHKPKAVSALSSYFLIFTQSSSPRTPICTPLTLIRHSFHLYYKKKILQVLNSSLWSITREARHFVQKHTNERFAPNFLTCCKTFALPQLQYRPERQRCPGGKSVKYHPCPSAWLSWSSVRCFFLFMCKRIRIHFCDWALAKIVCFWAHIGQTRKFPGLPGLSGVSFLSDRTHTLQVIRFSILSL